MNIDKIVTHGHFDVRRIINLEDYEKTREEFADKYTLLPEAHELPFDLKDCRILLSPLIIQIYHECGVFEYHFEAGFPTDYASVPSLLRGAVDNDSPHIVPPAFVHDANFRYHLLSFEKSNLLFKKMMKYYGASWWLRLKAYFGVSTSAGRKAYDQPKPLDTPLVRFYWKDS